MRIATLITLMIVLNKGYSQNLELWLPSTDIIIGEKINCSLIILDIDTLNFLNKKEFKFSSENKFRYSFQISPKKLGKYKLGPFSINYAGKELKSNVIEINVIEPSFEMSKINIELPEKIKRNEKITISFVSSLSSINKLNLKESANFEIISQSTNSHFSFVNNKSVKTYTKTYIIRFSTKGKFTIDESWLDFLPEQLLIKPISIKVH